MFRQLDFDLLRQDMVNKQLIPRGINDERVIKAFRTIPRHKFVPQEYQKSSYGDFPLPIGDDQTISQPYIVALMTQILEIKDTEKVLEVGTGSGYQAAILSSLAKEVYSVERIESLAKKSEEILKEFGLKNIRIKVGDGTLGFPEFSPYDKIMVTAAAPYLPETLLEQLNLNGKIALPLSIGFGQILTLFTKEKDKLRKEEICGCTFVPLVGKYGYKQ